MDTNQKFQKYFLKNSEIMPVFKVMLKNCSVEYITTDIHLFFPYSGGLNVIDHILQFRKYFVYKNILFSQHSVTQILQTLLFPI